MSTLYVSDLDGTLLTREEKISAYSRDRLNRLIGAGMPFTFATARAAVSARHAVEGLTLSIPVILYNGGLIYDFNTKTVLRSTFFEEECKRYVLTVLKDHGILPFVFCVEDKVERIVWRAGGETEGMMRYLSRRHGDDRLKAVTDEWECIANKVFYFKCIGPRGQLESAWNILKYDSRVICIFHQETYQNDFWMEISPREATKANAVTFVKERLGFDRVVCFGDTSNDSDMFDVCDEKYAVMNADGWLKEKATGVIGYCEEDGVAKWLEAHSGF